jgi:hypothetical protein
MKKLLFLGAMLTFICGLTLSAQTHHWPLTENLNDVVGDLHGTNHGVTFVNDAERGPVAYFDGETAVADLPSFVNGLTEITVAVWFRMDESRVWSRIYSFGEGDETEPKDVMMVIPVGGNNNMYRFTLSNPEGTWYDIDFPVEIVDIQLDTWYYSTVVLKPDSILVYHDGEQIFAEGGFERAFGTLNDVENKLGKSFWAADPLWKGALSDLRVYDSALTPAEVKALYDETKAASAEVPEPDHHWPLTADLTDAAGDLDGTNNGVTFENDAERGPVAYFDGESAYANLPSFVNGLTEITIAVWFRMDESRVWSRIYSFGEGDGTEPKDVMMVIPVGGNNNMYRFTLANPGGTWYDIDFPVEIVDIQTDTWYQSTVVLKPDSILVYHDGEQIFAEGGFERAFGTLNDVENALGKSFWVADPLWKGAISDLRVWNSALTPAQVKEVYDATSGVSGISEKELSRDVPLVYTDYNRIVVKLDRPRNDEVVSVFSVTGALVAQKPVSQISTISFNTGIYIVRVVGSNVNYATKVFVK